MTGKQWIKRIYLLGGLVNVLGIPVFSKFFTNEYLTSIDPAVFSHVGLFVVILWGFAYIAVSNHYEAVPSISLVFACEKFFYAGIWMFWLKDNIKMLNTIWQNDLITGLFYSVYGLNDFLFGVFFFFVFMQVRKNTACG